MSVSTGAENLFADKDQSQKYSLYRPNPPKELIAKIITFIEKQIKPPFNQAVDVGCGSGQSTGLLAPYFKHVLGIDVSETQINEAIKKETIANIQYKTGSSDSIPLPDASVELVTAATAVHWFHLPSFFKEVDRVLKPGGVLALFTNGFPNYHEGEKSQELKDHLDYVYNVETLGCWHENRKIADDMYRGIKLPYEGEIRERIMSEEQMWKLSDFLGYMQTWSGFQKLMSDNPKKANEVLQRYQDKMLKTLNVSTAPENTEIKFHINYALVMARKPSA